MGGGMEGWRMEGRMEGWASSTRKIGNKVKGKKERNVNNHAYKC